MSDNDHDHPLIRNEETLRRRAWIDRALAGVRGRLKPAELGEASAPSEASSADPAEPTGEGSRPKLYLVRNSETG